MINKLLTTTFIAGTLISCTGGGGGGGAGSPGANGNGNGNGQPTERLVGISSPIGINNSNKANYPVTGNCSHNDEVVTVTASTGESAEIACVNNTFTVTLDLSSHADGTQISFTASHGEKEAAPTVEVEKDTIVPNIVFPTYSAGVIASSNLSNFGISGSCDEDGTTIGLTIGSTTVTTTCSGGTYDLTGNDFTSEADGPLTIVEFVIDPAGNRVENLPGTINKDTTGPNLTATMPAILASNASTYSFSGDCEDGMNSVEIDVAGVLDSVSCSGNAFTSNPLNLSGVSDGSLTVSIYQDDDNGNRTTITPSPVKDVIAPTLALTGTGGRSVSYWDHDSDFMTPDVPFDQMVYPMDPSEQLLLEGTCSENLQTVVAKIDGNAVSTPVNFICDGTNFTGTFDFNTTKNSMTWSNGYFQGQITLEMSDIAGNTTTTDPIAIRTNSGFTNLWNLASNGDWIGYAIAVSDDILATSAPTTDLGGFDRGIVYTYKRVNGGWEYVGTIERPSNATDSDTFGTSLAVEGNTLVVGCKWCQSGGSMYGKAFVYTFDGTSWSTGEELVSTAYTTQANDEFGSSVDIDGGKIVVGSQNSEGEGAVSIFSHNGTNYVEDQRIVASDGAAGDKFGRSVAISGNRIVVGAPETDYGNMNDGSIYIYSFDGSTWSEDQKIVEPNVVGFAYLSNDNFGADVDIDGDRIIAGDPRIHSNGGMNFQNGAVFVFEHDGSNFVRTATIEAPDLADEDYFGESLYLDGDFIAVGAPNKNYINTDGGKAYVFKYDGSNWNQIYTSANGNSNAKIGEYDVVLHNGDLYYSTLDSKGYLYQQRIDPADK